MKLLLTTILLLTSPDILPETGSVSSSNASYDGNALVLKGQVVLDHGLGKMQAEEASLQKQEIGKDFPFSFIHLNKEVLLSLKNQASVKCETADLDFTALKGVLSSEDHVVYTDHLKKKKGVLVPLQLLSKTAELLFTKKEAQSPDQKGTFEVDTVAANEAVRIDYGTLFSLFADHAIYRKGEMNPSEMGFQKNISVFPEKEEGSCRLTYLQNQIEAATIDLDLIHSKVVMLKPHGTLHASLAEISNDQNVTFNANALVWDHHQNTLTLQGDVSFNEPSLGSIHSQDELIVVQEENKLSSLETKGKTTLEYTDTHKLLCFGALRIDRERLHAFGDSPLVEGIVPEGKQIYYEEKEVGIFADHAQVEYSSEKKSFQPVSISLKGHVLVFTQDPQKPARCGIADRVTYLPTTRTLILRADPGKKVLFMNEAENLKISAQEVHVTEDPITKKQNVKGVGNVQLSFTAEEQELMQKMFHL